MRAIGNVFRHIHFKFNLDLSRKWLFTCQRNVTAEPCDHVFCLQTDDRVIAKGAVQTIAELPVSCASPNRDLSPQATACLFTPLRRPAEWGPDQRDSALNTFFLEPSSNDRE